MVALRSWAVGGLFMVVPLGLSGAASAPSPASAQASPSRGEPELPAAARGPVDFASQIQPLFEQFCHTCHGPASQSSGLRLDNQTAALKGGHSGPAILPGDSANSRLIHMVAGYQVKVRMPPVGDPLTGKQIGLLRAWIDQGAVWPDSEAETSETTGSSEEPGGGHWSFQPLTRPAVPAGGHPIDAFVRARLRSEGMTPSEPALRETLIRRVSLDITGLPPTPGEVAAFFNDRREDSYGQLIDRLLASEHFGEKWAMHWLDQVRYADSDGYAKDYVRPHAWRYRRWVIQALNANMPFDQFSIEQIAGDLLPGATVEQRVATGFHRNTLKNREGGVNPEQYLFEETVDRASTLGGVWLGLTVGCAQCHDHKYDPLTQKDFYRLFAFFDNLEERRIYAPIPGELGPHLKTVNEYREKHQAILDEYHVPAIQAEWEKKSLKAAANPGVSTDWDLAYQELGLNTDGGQKIVRAPAAERSWRQANMVTYYFLGAYRLVSGAEEYKKLGFREALDRIKKLNASYQQLSEARVVFENPVPHPTFLRVRGAWDRPGVEVTPGTPAALPALPRAGVPDRLGLARWLFSHDNPLTARVAVNRIWQEYFGRGLVASSENFGTQGDPPSHPKLLDWLAAEFRDSGWDQKYLHRLILTSQTYRQSSNIRPELAGRDPANVLLARQSRLRLPAELIWDSALAVSGLLHHQVGGKSFRPEMPPGTTGFKAGGTDWEPSQGTERYKRGTYIQFQRTQPFPFLTNFDSPEFNATVCRRERSNTPLQALNLLNGPTFSEAGQALAVRVLTESPAPDFQSRLRHAFRLALAREPDDYEKERFFNYWTRRRDLLASSETPPTGSIPALEGHQPEDLMAWSGVTRILINLDEFVTRP